MADWSVLPSDILGEIALKFEFIEDFICFSVACHSWNHASSMVKPEWSRRAYKPTPPWLLLAVLEPGNNGTSQEKMSCKKIFNINKYRCYEITLPQKRCWGSSYGWIVMFGADQQIQLFNPITKAHLSLPSLSILPDHPLNDDDDDDDDDDNDDVDDDDDDNHDGWILKYIVRNIFVLNLSRNDNVDDFVVMVIHQPCDHLSFARPGDRAWTRVLTSATTMKQVHQVMCWKGIVLLLYIDGAFAYFDIDSTLTATPVKAKDYYSLLPVSFVDTSQGGLSCGGVYMVELNGDLLAVVRCRVHGPQQPVEYGGYGLPLECRNWYRTIKFEVYKEDNSLWKKVEDVGDFVLFVGYNYASSVHISMAPNCQRNAIYFVDDELYYYGIQGRQVARGHDMGMFDMSSGEITPFYKDGDTISEFFAPIWFTPNF